MVAKKPGIRPPDPLSYTGPKFNLMPVFGFTREPTVSDNTYLVSSFVVILDNPSSGKSGDLWYLSEYDTAGDAIWLQLQSSSNSSELVWSVITTATKAIEVNNGYFADRGAGVAFTLPVTSAVGDTFIVNNINAGGFTIAQNASQTIFIGNSNTTTGISGSVASTDLGDSIILVCSAANTDFRAAYPPQGSLTLI